MINYTKNNHHLLKGPFVTPNTKVHRPRDSIPNECQFSNG